MNPDKPVTMRHVYRGLVVIVVLGLIAWAFKVHSDNAAKAEQSEREMQQEDERIRRAVTGRN